MSGWWSGQLARRFPRCVHQSAVHHASHLATPEFHQALPSHQTAAGPDQAEEVEFSYSPPQTDHPTKGRKAAWLYGNHVVRRHAENPRA